jgi:hypothetical protein
MTRARVSSRILGVVVLLVLVSQSASAIGPAFVVLHGGGLQNPIVLRPAIGSLTFMWAGGNFYEHQREMKIPSGLEGRRYLDYDVFWGRFTPEEVLKPELASQHGRLYLQTADQAAAVVLTSPDMDGGPGATRAQARPVPRQLKDFVSGRALTPGETAALVAAGVPMK